MPAERDSEREIFLRNAGWKGGVLSVLPGDASTRRYFRVVCDGAQAMLMDQPQNAEAPSCPQDASPDEREAMGYNAVARLAGGDCGRFVANAEFLRTLNLSAPEILAFDAASGFVLMEDLGDSLYTDQLAGGADKFALYSAAVDVLARLHETAAPQSLTYQKPLYGYDQTALMAEVELLPDWYLPLVLGRDTTAGEHEDYRSLWRDVLNALPERPPVYVHRDYHAQNLIWLPERSGPARVGLIDFQDSVAGNSSYDLVSLLEDARQTVNIDLQDTMLNRYLSAMRDSGKMESESEFRLALAVFGAQRNTKILGIFARLFKRDGKPRYLSYLPRVWGYLERDLRHPALADLKHWYARMIPEDIRNRIPIVEAQK